MAFKFKFQEQEAAQSWTVNQNHLRLIEGRMAGLKTTLKLSNGELTQKQYDSFLKYLKDAHKDIKSKMSEKELADYKIKTADKTAEEIAKELKAVEKEMDKNKDKPSH